jgi:hypothetical protein
VRKPQTLLFRLKERLDHNQESEDFRTLLSEKAVAVVSQVGFFKCPDGRSGWINGNALLATGLALGPFK